MSEIEFALRFFYIVYCASKATVENNEKFTAMQIIFSSNQFRVISSAKKLFSRNFCDKKRMAVKFRNFHTVHVDSFLVSNIENKDPW